MVTVQARVRAPGGWGGALMELSSDKAAFPTPALQHLFQDAVVPWFTLNYAALCFSCSLQFLAQESILMVAYNQAYFTYFRMLV